MNKQVNRMWRVGLVQWLFFPPVKCIKDMDGHILNVLAPHTSDHVLRVKLFNYRETKKNRAEHVHWLRFWAMVREKWIKMVLGDKTVSK